MKSMKKTRQLAARLARATEEDRQDEAWLAECLRMLEQTAKERGVAEFWMAFEADHPPHFPPRPAGFRQRREFCNRCGQRLERSEEHDAYFCRRCNRWTESRCEQPGCISCSNRPARPLP